MAVFDNAMAGLDQIIERVRSQLTHHRSNEAGEDDDHFIRGLIQQFIDAALRQPHGAGAINMALASYRMAVQQMKIDELTDAVEMRDAGLQLIWAISDHADEQEKNA